MEANQQPLEIIRGTTRDIAVTIVNSAGDAHTLGNGETLRFAVKKNREDLQPELSKDFGADEYDAANECYVLHIFPADTESMKFGRYYYDIGLQTGDDYYNVVPCSPFDVLPNITARRVDDA